MLPAIISGVAAAVIFFFVGFFLRKVLAEKKIGSAEAEVKRMVEEGKKEAEAAKKEILVEAKDEAFKIKNDAEREAKERRGEVQRQERRISQKEENLDRKLENLEKKEETLNNKIKENEERRAVIEQSIVEQDELLQKIAGMSMEDAKAELMERVESENRHEMAMKLSELEQEYKESAEDKAKNLIAMAIQRCAADSGSEQTVSVGDLPNDEMKGRIIGREGRNIRAIETLTGVDLIIDDTPEAIAISTFDPVRREVARLALEKLVSDGRIHPSRVEEMVEKCRKEVDTAIKKAGEQATFETGIHGLNPELIKLLGRLKYRTSYGQNVLRHSVEVSLISGMIASELGVDAVTAKRAGLLHDIGKAMTHEIDGSHVQIGVDIARKYKESKEIIHAIEAHHGDVEPSTYIAMIVQAADAISAARPGARRENLENYIKRLQKLEEIATSFEGIDKAFAIQAGREVRIMVKPDQVSDDDMIFLARDIAHKVESELEYPGQIKINVVRETRQSEYAK
ncbi:MAG: ribonuclease Y [Clostridiales bacterium]|nr:ribonuclease Y [Candidatus Coliplasma caballi]